MRAGISQQVRDDQCHSRRRSEVVEGEEGRRWRSRSESLHDLDHHDEEDEEVCESWTPLRSAESRGCVAENKQSKDAVVLVASLDENRLR